ncbi:GAF domain-containing protein [Actinoplanes sp. CA-252034]|uniref:GAF domain-containing protein n=1 Tax=Actinoplanes sp. CA-252034 TaxID=3239906 RepID=UPI003D97CDDA
MRLFEAASTPGTWSFVTGETVVDADLGRPDHRWPGFAQQARDDGFRSVAAVPMRIRGEIVGVLSVLRTRTGRFSDEALRLTRALANVATVGLLVHRDAEYRTVLAVQSQQVLTGRMAVERARGILAELLDVDVDVALQSLRRHAGRTGRTLRATAMEVVNSLPRAGQMNGTDSVLLVQRIATTTLPGLRMQVRQRLVAAGLSGAALDSFLLAIHEAAVNAQEHGGGGRLWLWRHAGNMWCEISDDGPGLPADLEARIEAPHVDGLPAAGLWLIRRICPDLEITSSPHGTRLLLRQSLPGHPSESASAAGGG